MKRLSSLLIVALLTACGGGGGGNSLPSTPPAPHGGNGTMSLKVSFNRSGANTIVRGGKRRNYVSYSTQGLGIDVVAHVNNGTNTLPKTTLAALRTPELAVTIAPGHTGNNVSCTAASAGAFSCTILVPATAGYDDVQITAWDQAPDNGVEGVGGTFNGTAGNPLPNDLSTSFLSDQLVLANQSNSFNFTMDGVVNSVAVTASVGSLVSGAPLGQNGTITTALSSGGFAGSTTFAVASVVGLQPGDTVTIGSGAVQDSLVIATITDGANPSFTTASPSANTHGGGDAVTYSGPINPAAITLSVEEFDAQGNRIIGSDPLADANGNPVTVTVQPDETTPAGGQIGDTGSAITLSGTACISNTCAYTTPDGTAQIGYNGYDLGSVQFAPVVSCGAATCAAPAGGGLRMVPVQIPFSRMTDGSLNVPGPQSTLQISAGEGVSPLIGSVALGPDGADWFGISAGGGGGTNVGHIFKIAPAASPVPQDFDLSASSCDASGGVNAIAPGPDGAMWFAAVDGGGSPVLCSITTNGSVHGFGNLAFGAGSFSGMVLDRTGIMWVVATDAAAEGWALGVDATGTIVKRWDLGSNVNASQATLGAVDGRVYVSLANGIAEVDPLGPPTFSAMVIPASGITMNNPGNGIASTPDGSGGQYVFISENGSIGSTGHVDRYDGTAWTQTSIPNSTTYIVGLTVGPDGNVYAATDGSEVARINPALFPAAGSVATIATGRSWAVAPGSDNSVWVAQWQTGYVTKIALP